MATRHMPIDFFDNDVWSYLSVDGLEDNNITVTLTRTKSSDGAGPKTWTMTKTANDDGVVYTDYALREGKYIFNIVGHTDAVIFKPNNMDIHAGDVYNVKITGVGKTVDYDVSFFDPDHVSSESNPVTKINLDQSILNSDNQLALTKGESYDLTKYISIEPSDADDQDLSYSSSDETVATCTNGTIQALKAGETTITVKSTNDVTLTIPVKVTDQEAAQTVSVPKGKTYTYDGEEHEVKLPDHVVYADDRDSDKTATDVGDYTYYVKPEDGYTWEDGTTDEQEIKWSITKADNSAETFEADDVTYPEKPSVKAQLKYLDDDKKILYKEENASDDDYTTEMPTTPGTYIVKVSSEGNHNVNAFENERRFIIHKGKIDDTDIQLEDQSVSYDGQDHSKDIQVTGINDDDQVDYRIFDADGYEVSEAVEPGTYKIVATIQREYYDNLKKTATLTITEKEKNENAWTTPLTISSDDITYGDDYDVKAVSQYGDVTYTYQNEYGYTSSEKPTQAGTYTVIASVDGTNQYTSLKAEKRFTIKRKKVSIPDVTTKFVYDGNMHQICEYGAYYYISNASESEAGSYSSKLMLYDNYEWEDGTTSDKEYSWTIEKAPNKITENNVYDMTYGDDPGANVRLKYNDDKKVISYRKIEESDYHSELPDSAGSYVMKITCKGNQNIEDFTDYIYFTVKRAPNTWVQTLPYGKVFSYGEDYQMTAKAAHGDVTYTYYDYYGRLLNHKPTDVGTYTIKASGEGTDQYEPIKDEQTFEIQPKKVAIPQPVTFIYDGNTHSISETEAYSVSGSATEPGEYTATLHLKNNNNYCWEDETINDQEVTYKIVKSSDKISLDQSILENGQLILPDNNYTYDLSKYVKDEEAKLTFSSDDESVVSCQDGKLNTKNKGTANITVKDDDGAKITIPVKVISHIVQIPEGKTLTYNGTKQKGFDLPEGALYDEPNRPEGPVAKDAGYYYFYIKLKDGFIWNDGTNNLQHISWSIKIADNEAESFNVRDVTYPEKPDVTVQLKYLDDKKKIEYKKVDASDDAYTTAVPSSPGDYDVKVTCPDSKNVNSFEEVKSFTIYNATLDASDFEMSDQTVTYDGADHSHDVQVTGTDSNDEVSYEITDENGDEVASAIEPGVYHICATIHRDNYDDAYKYATLTITKKDKNENAWTTPLTISSDDITYGDDYKVNAESKYGDVTYTYKDENGSVLLEKPTNAGTYTVIAQVEGTKAYTSLKDEKTFTIKRKQVEIPEITRSFTYDGKEHRVCEDGDHYHLYYALQTSAGLHYSVLVISSNNYEWSDGTTNSKEIYWTITKADNSAETFDVNDVTYPEKPVVDVKLKYLDDDKKIEYKKEDASDDAYTTAVPSSPGDYDVRVTCQGSDNVNAFKTTKTFTIYNATLDASGFEMSNQTVTYDGADHSHDVQVTGTDSNDEVSYELTDENGDKVASAIEPGVYNICATIHRDNYDDVYKYATLTITETGTSTGNTETGTSTGNTGTGTSPGNTGSTSTGNTETGTSTGNTGTGTSPGNTGSTSTGNTETGTTTDNTKPGLTTDNTETNKPVDNTESKGKETPIVPLSTTQAIDRKVTTLKGDRDISGSKFGLLQAKGMKVTKSSIKVQWKKIKGAKGYIVYGNKCGKNYQKLKSVKGLSWTQRKLKKGTYYKYMVVAYNAKGMAIAYSKTLHVTTLGGKKANPKNIKLKSPKKLTLKVNKKAKIKASYVLAKKAKMSNHRGLAYESSNTKVARVSKKGQITAKKKGVCTIYVYGQNGTMNKVQVKVQ